MPHVVTAIVLAIFVLAVSVWFGGYVAIPIFVRVVRATLPPQQSVPLFRRLGQTYARVGTPALLIAYAAGLILVYGQPWSALLIVMIVLAAVLLAALLLGMVQARQMTRLRRALVAAPDDAHLGHRVRTGARVAGGLRASLGVLSVILIVLGAFLVT